LNLALFMMETFGFASYRIFLSTRPEKFTGSDEMWEEATEMLRGALVRQKILYDVDPGGGVFYGPKIDIKLEDALGRRWQGPTIQVDFNLPHRFDAGYVGGDSREHQVVMVHRTVLGSMERFLACLIEHYAGAFPVWLAPVQVVVIPVADRHLDYARKLEVELRSERIRVKVDARSESVNSKIRQAQLEKVPYMALVGDKEVAASTVSVRLRRGEQLAAQSFGSLKEMVKTAIVNKSEGGY